jgi:cytochrome bd ubiquinol oxidase subunit I
VSLADSTLVSPARARFAWQRAKDERWLRLRRLFRSLFPVDVVIGVGGELVQEFRFGLNRSERSKFSGNVLGAPLATQGIAAFLLGSTLPWLWLSGWERRSRRLHLALVWLLGLLGPWRVSIVA